MNRYELALGKECPPIPNAKEQVMIKDKYEKNEVIDFSNVTWEEFMELCKRSWNAQRKINQQLSTEEIIEQMREI
jgi:hypothetical protein